MKATNTLKEQLHSLIDSIEDEQVLKVLNDDIVPFVINSHVENKESPDDNLSPEEIAELDAAYKKMEAEDIATMTRFREAMSKYRSA
jgi:hypothetical protein